MDLAEGDPSLMRLNQEKIKQHLSQCLDDSFPFRMLKDEDTSLVGMGNGNGQQQTTSNCISMNLVTSRNYELDEQHVNNAEALRAEGQSLQLVDDHNNGDIQAHISAKEGIEKVEDIEIGFKSNQISGYRHYSQTNLVSGRQLDQLKDHLHDNLGSIPVIEAVSENLSQNPKDSHELESKEENREKKITSNYLDQQTSKSHFKSGEQKPSIGKRDLKSIFFWNKVNQIKRRFIQKLIQRVPSVRFKHLTPNQFSFINDPASEYEYYVYENRLIFSQAVYENGIVITNRFKIFKIYSFDLIRDILVFTAFLLAQLHRDSSGSTRYFDFIVLFKFADIPSKLNDIETKLQIGSTKSAWLKLIKLEFLVLLIAHVACCVFLLIGLEQGENNLSWITKYQYQNLQIGQKYIISFYYIIITMTTIGYGDITPATQYEKSFIIIVALLATNVFAYSFSQISEIVKNEEQRKQQYNRTMNGINNEMNKRGLNLLLQNKVRKYHEHLQYENEQKQFNRLNIFDSLPPLLREEVMQDVNAVVVDRIFPLKKFSQECKRQISLVIKQKVFFPEETIFQENETNDCIYYVAQGCVISSVQVKTREGKTKSLPQMNIQTFQVRFLQLNQKGYIANVIAFIFPQRMCVFGYETFLLGKRSPYSARANGVAVISYLERKDLMNILKEFPLDYEWYQFIRDEAVLSQKTGDLMIQCNSCHDSTHSLKLCPYVKFIANKLKQSKKDVQINSREKYKRKRELSNQSLANLFEIQLQAKEIIFEIDKENIIEELHSMIDEQNLEANIAGKFDCFENTQEYRGEYKNLQTENGSESKQNELIHKTDFLNRNPFIMSKNQSEGAKGEKVKQSKSGSQRRIEVTIDKEKNLFIIDEREEPNGTYAFTPQAKSAQQMKENFGIEKKYDSESQESSSSSPAVQSIKMHLPSVNEIMQERGGLCYQDSQDHSAQEEGAKSEFEMPSWNRDAISAGEMLPPLVIAGISEKKQGNFPNSADFTSHQGKILKRNSRPSLKIFEKPTHNNVKKYLDVRTEKRNSGSTEQYHLHQEEEGFHSRFLEAAQMPLKEGCELLDKVFHRRAEKAKKTYLEERKVIQMQSKESQLRYISNKQPSVEELIHAVSNVSNHKIAKKSSFHINSQNNPVLPSDNQLQQNHNVNKTPYFFPQSVLSPPKLDGNMSFNDFNEQLSPLTNYPKKPQNNITTNNMHASGQKLHLFACLGSSDSVSSQQITKLNRRMPSKEQINQQISPWRHQKYGDDLRKEKSLMTSEVNSPRLKGYTHTISQQIGQKQQYNEGNNYYSNGNSGQTGIGIVNNGNTIGNIQYSPADKAQKNQTSRQSSNSHFRMNTLTANHPGVPGFMNNSAQIQLEESFSSEYQIRCKENLQDLDMLICRKNLLMEQEKGNINNFIMVHDNEIDIDTMKEWQIYYRKYNYLFVLYKMRKQQEELLFQNMASFRQAASVKANNLTKSVARKNRNNEHSYSSIIRRRNSYANFGQHSAHQLQLSSLKF